jgi:hypothetical protein
MRATVYANAKQWQPDREMRTPGGKKSETGPLASDVGVRAATTVAASALGGGRCAEHRPANDGDGSTQRGHHRSVANKGACRPFLVSAADMGNYREQQSGDEQALVHSFTSPRLECSGHAARKLPNIDAPNARRWQGANRSVQPSTGGR